MKPSKLGKVIEQFFVLSLFVGCVAMGCEETKLDTPQKNFERPIDMAFFCAGPVGSGENELSPLGADLCDVSWMWCEGTDEECEETLSERTLLGLVLNSARGELGLVNVTQKRLLDVSHQQPGFSFVPVGPAPVAVGISSDGCAGVTLNGGSCNASVVDTAGLLELTGAEIAGDTQERTLVRTVPFMTDSGRILARPAELIMVPGEQWPPPVGACEGTSGKSAFVSFPGCGLVAQVDLDDGKILQSMKVTRDGVEDAGTDPLCPRECSDFSDDSVGGGVLSDDRPAHLAYRSFVETGRSPKLFIAPDKGSYVASVSITPEGDFNFDNQQVVILENVRLGIRKIRMSPISPPPKDRQFLYVVTKDGDIRVVDIAGEPITECETNPDPRDPFFEAEDWYEFYRGCIPLDEDVMRAPLSKTPGINLPENRRVVDVGFSIIDGMGYEEELDSLDPYRLNGIFGYAVTMDGAGFVINVDEWLSPEDIEGEGTEDIFSERLEDGIHAVLGHQIRNSTDTRSEEDGPPRAEEPFTYYRRGTPVEDPPAGITLEEVIVDDPKVAVSETWTLVYEGVLPESSRETGYVVQPDASGGAAETAEFRDTGSEGFCQTGVVAGDRLIIHGCSFDSDCPKGFGCLDNPRTGQDGGGVCMDSDYVRKDDARDECLPLAMGTREYEILGAYDESLVLGLTLAPGTPCESPADCEIKDEPDLSFVCEDGRCAVDCSETGVGGEPIEDCAVVSGVCEEGRCINAPLPDRKVTLSGEEIWCIPTMVAYEIRGAGDYLVTGSSSGVMVARTVDDSAGGLCVDDTEESPLLRFRMEPTPDVFSNPMLSLFLQGTENRDDLLREDSVIFNLVGGFQAMGMSLASRLPSVAVSAPDGRVYIVDMGDDVQTAGGVAGQVVRILTAEVVVDPDFLIR